MSTPTEQAPQVQTIDEKEHGNVVKEAHEKAVCSKDGGQGHAHHDVKEEVHSYALENAFSWPVSLVMGLNHNDHQHHSHAKPKQEKQDKEVQHAVENAFSWPVSLVMHLIHESQGNRSGKPGNQKEAGSQVKENLERAGNTIKACCIDTTSS